MIPHKNLFASAFGKYQNIGNDRIYTTPHTVSIPAEYTINVNYNVQGDLAGHSLDGRLWLYRRSRRLGIIALMWNAKKGELEYAAAQNLSNNNDVILACGLDWILTNNNIFLVSDEEPYIRSTGLFDANIPDTFLYSILRVGDVGSSGIDSFTGEAWGKRNDNGNSEGTGYFSKTTHLLYPAGSHSFEQCYSLLPAFGDWQIFENFLVRRPDAESIDSYNYMQVVRPLIPLEFSNGVVSYGTGYNFDHRGIQLLHRNGEIWGRGLLNIGRVSLLPAVFGENGTVQEYYLYIAPDFQCDTDSILYDDWQNVSLVALGTDSLYGVISEQSDAMASGCCVMSTDGRVFVPKNGEWLTLLENNGRCFFDTLSHKGLSIDDNGAQLLLGESISDTQNIECRTLPQWLAPTGKIDAVAGEYVVAPADNAAFCTSLVTGFNRQFISPNTIPLTAKAFQDSNENYYRLAISDGVNENNRKIFGVNKIFTQGAIQWQDIYKEPVNITFVNTVEIPESSFSCIPLMYDQYSGFNENNCVTDGGTGIPDLLIFTTELSFTVALLRETISVEGKKVSFITYVDTSHSVVSSSIDHQTSLLYEVFPDNNPYPELTEVYGYITLSASATVGFLNPSDGSVHYVSFSKNFSHSLSESQNGNTYLTTISKAEVPYGIGYVDNSIGFYGYIYDSEKGYLYDKSWSRWGNPAPMVFFPCANMPDFVSQVVPSDDIIIQPSIITPETNSVLGWTDKNNPCYVVFQEYSSGVKFVQLSSIHMNQSFVDYSLAGSVTYPNYSTKFIDSGGVARSRQNFHLVVTENSALEKLGVSIFHSEVHPEIFDLYTELERSKPL